MTFLSDLFGGKNKKLRAMIHDWSERSYAPYTQKMLNYGCRLRYAPTNQENVYASLKSNKMTGQVHEIIFSKNIKMGDYGMACAAEHESVHVDQLRYLQQPSITLHPEDEYKMQRTKEVEAYGREAYKVAFDFCNGNTDEDDVAPVFEKNPFPSYYMLSIIEGRPLHRKKEALMDSIKAIKNEKALLEVEKLLPEFYCVFSEDEGYMDNISGRAIANIMNTGFYLMGADNSGNRIRDNYDKETALFSQRFELEDAKNLLARDGSDPVSAMNGHHRKVFWDNICYLTDQQKKELEAARDFIGKVHPGVL